MEDLLKASLPPSASVLRGLLPGCLQTLMEAGMERSLVYRYARGEVIPKADRAALIEELTGVPANGWRRPR